MASTVSVAETVLDPLELMGVPPWPPRSIVDKRVGLAMRREAD